jgi:catechol-2,3-dioxygenase
MVNQPPKRSLGHVVLNVSSLSRSLPFYQAVFGLKDVGRIEATARDTIGDIIFLSFGEHHHDLGLRERPTRRLKACSSAERPMREAAPGLCHIAFKVGAEIEDLRNFAKRLLELDVAILKTVDHGQTKSVYFTDPDGLMLEAYVGDDALPANREARFVAKSRPFRLEADAASTRGDRPAT